MSPQLALHFLGTPQLSLDNSPISVERRKAVALLTYLAVNREMHSREVLSALLWPDYEQSKAFTNLRHTLWEIQQTIGEDWLDTSRDKIGLNRQADIWLDVDHFKSLLGQSHTQSDVPLRVSLLADSAKLYRNHFLTGFSLKDALTFNEWAFAESEELRRNLVEALNTLSGDYITLGQAEKAIPYARRLITLDPLNEASHRKLMEVYLQAGQHSAALKQYQACEQILRKELGLDPQPETLALYKRIRKGEIKPAQVLRVEETNPPKHNLPSQLSSFIGREKEQTQIVNLIVKNRLVTLMGTGGIGKTSLALQVGQKLLNEYPNGVWFIALDSLDDPALVAQTVAAVFDIRESNDRSIIEILINKLCEKTTLLILDNCEHVVEACTQLATTLLSNCSKLKILATSREVLNVSGEATYRTPSLSIPEQDKASLEKLTEYESIRLFTERATLASSSFTLTEENAQAVIDICHRLDGIPLAIELAAAHVNMFSTDQIAARLNESFNLLTGGSRTALPRQQTIHASVEWSWNLLSDPEKILLRRLSVFAGGWTLEATESICCGSDIESQQALELMSQLVRKSLVMVKQATGRETRYHFHEMIRQYAREKLDKSGEAELIHTQHLIYFLKLSEEIEYELRGPQQIEWLARAHTERDNIRVALEWADKTNVEAGLLLSGRLHRFWGSFDMHEGMHWLTTFIEKSESQQFPHARAQALLRYGWQLFWSDKFDPARIYAQECLEFYKVCDDKYGEVDALTLLGSISQAQGKVDMELFQQALSISQLLKDTWREAHILSRLSNAGGDHQRRLAYLKKAIILFRKLGDLRSLAGHLADMGNLELLSGNLETAQKLLNEAVQLNRQLNNKATSMGNLTGLSHIESMQGNFEKGRAFLEEGISIAEELGNRMHYLWARAHLGYLSLLEGKISQARDILVETTQEFHSDQSEIGVAFTLEGLASLCVAVHKPEQAARLIGWANTTREKVSDPRPPLEQADVDKTIAECLAKMGEVAFSDAYETGQKLTLDEAVALALSK